MTTKFGFPYAEVRFDRAGAPVDSQDVVAAQAMVRDNDLTDMLVLVHGWNNNMQIAGHLYEEILSSARPAMDGELKAALAGRRFGAVGVYWPSMRYTDPDLISGGAASSDPNTGFGKDLDAALEVFTEGPVHDAVRKLKDNLAAVEDKPSLRQQFLDAVRQHLPSIDDPEVPLVSKNLKNLAQVEERLSVNLEPSLRADGRASSSIFAGAINAVRNLLNLTTYYEMKDRAGRIGESGGLGLLHDLKQVNPALKVHLIGHSFGGRLISGMARGGDSEAPLPVDSLHLLQAAFSHYGFGEANAPAPEGYFHRVLTEHRVRGPILITHTKNDQAVGLAYVVASTLAGQNASSFGGPDDPYGAIGSNGALNAHAQAIELTPTSALQFRPGQVYNLHADFIKDHGNVGQPGVLRAVLYAIATT